MTSPSQNDSSSTIPPLPEDNDTPFSPPDSPSNDTTDQAVDREVENTKLDSTHQATDSATNIDSHEEYDEGLSGAAEASEPNAGNTVVDYNPDKDERNLRSQ